MKSFPFSARTKSKIIGAMLVVVGMMIIFPLGQGNGQETIQKLTKAEEVVTTSIEVKSPRVERFVDNEFADVETKKETLESREYIDTGAYFIRSTQNPDFEKPLIPDRIIIPAIELDTDIISAEFHFTDLDGDKFGQWKAPEFFAAGWHPDSALLGAQGNTVINGHHNVHGEVFKELVNLEIGDEIIVLSRNQIFTYVVANRMILPERYTDLETRIENARWLGKSDDQRLTLVTCWPENTNSHRLILVAKPVSESGLN